MTDPEASPIWKKAHGGAFAPVGDEQRVLIVVQRGRQWFPTGEPAEAYPATITIRGESRTEYASLSPYRIITTSE